jgi:alpha-tubulin suppressor-like RCC1 family protein
MISGNGGGSGAAGSVGGAAGMLGCVANGAKCDDRDPCTSNDHCAAGLCDGTPLTCATPPAAACVDAKTLRRYQAKGVCQGGTCGYSSSDSTCLAGCKGEACLPFKVSLSAGAYATCATLNGGPLKCWGGNFGGLIGDPKLNYTGPAVVPGLEGGVRAVSLGTSDACALTDAGGLKCWGGHYGQSVVNIPGVGSAVSTVACGSPYFDHTCVLNTSGALACWGANNFGQLGNAMTTDAFTYQYTIANVVGMSMGVLSISAGSNNTCAITTGGALWCWGMNWYGALGNGTLDNSDVPVKVSGLSSGVVAVSAGELYGCALTSAGGLKCWGWGIAGQPNQLVPTDIQGLTSGVRAVSVGTSTCAITNAGALKCWGANSTGQLGNGSNTPSATPVDVLGLSTGVVAVSVGEYHACAVTETGAIKCWGSGSADKLGNGDPQGSYVPVDVVGF